MHGRGEVKRRLGGRHIGLATLQQNPSTSSCAAQTFSGAHGDEIESEDRRRDALKVDEIN